MKVTKEHFDERSEPDTEVHDQGEYVWDDFTFSEGEGAVVFRRYTGETRAILKRPWPWKQVVDSGHLIRSAVQYLFTEEGVRTIDAYVPERGCYGGFQEAAFSAASAGLIPHADAEAIVRFVLGR